MKKLFLALSVMMVSLLSMNEVKAQINLSINIGSQPLWGPIGYDHVEYYYLPDIDAYYYVPSQQYVYQQGNRWIWSSSLPNKYRNFDLYNSYKVVMNNRRPYLEHNKHIKSYAKYKNYNGKQSIIRDSRDVKYNVVRGHQNFDDKNRSNNNNKFNKGQKLNNKQDRPERRNDNNNRQENNGRNNGNRPGRG